MSVISSPVSRRASFRYYLLGLGILLSCATPFVAPMIWNSVKFNRFAADVRRIPLPPNSHLILSGEEFGLLWGSSNGCAHQVRMLIASELDFDHVRKHYGSFSVKHPDEQAPERVQARVIPFEGSANFQASGSEFLYPLFPSVEYNWYLIEFEGWTEPGMDFRCS